MNTQGTRHLGAAVGTTTFKQLYVTNKVANWTEAVKNLAVIAQSELHAAFSAFTHALQCQWTFLSRVMPDIADLFAPLEHAIRTVFLKSLLKKDVNDIERAMLALPARLGGLGILNPIESSYISHENSKFISAPLVNLILHQEPDFDPREILDEVKMLRYIVDTKAQEIGKINLQDVLGKSTPC